MERNCEWCRVKITQGKRSREGFEQILQQVNGFSIQIERNQNPIILANCSDALIKNIRHICQEKLQSNVSNTDCQDSGTSAKIIRLDWENTSDRPSEITHKKFQLPFYCPEDNQEKEVTFYVRRRARISVGDVLNEMTRVVSKDKLIRTLRLVEIFAHRVCSIVDNDAADDVIQKYTTTARYYRAEEILEEEENVDSNECLVQVAHFYRNARATFGVPFFIKITVSDPWSAVKESIKTRLGVNEKDWSKIRVAVVQHGSPHFIEKDDDDLVVEPKYIKSGSKIFSGKPWIGLEHFPC